MPRSLDSFEKQAARAADWARRLRDRLLETAGDRSSAPRDERFAGLGEEITLQQGADRYAQTITAVTLIEQMHRRRLGSGLLGPLLDVCPAIERLFGDFRQRFPDRHRELETLAESAGRVDAGAGDDATIHFFEAFLARYDRGKRTRRGVYYTPGPLVEAIVEALDRRLRHQFGLAEGLADTTSWRTWLAAHPDISPPRPFEPNRPMVRLWDPAVGTGAFLVAAIRRVFRTFRERYDDKRETQTPMLRRAWTHYVRRYLLDRLYGYEVMTAAWAVAHLQVIAALHPTGFRFQPGDRLHLYRTDSLLEPERAPNRPRPEPPFTVVLGNPPFSGISRNNDPWIDDLLRREPPAMPDMGDYYHCDGRPLGERKHWLQDDYVKFFRLAQWQLHRAGAGLLGLVGNHGYLDNATFRGMRQSLMQSFSSITVVDLHGNVKKRERAPDGTADENVFQIEQGVAIGLMSRLPTGRPCRVRHVDLRGGRGEKLARLQKWACREAESGGRLSPTEPWYRFVPTDGRLAGEYARGMPLPEAMPIGSTAAVTARDPLVVDFDAEVLRRRIAAMRDETVPDETLRERFFPSARSTKYPPGDTRGWKLPEARRALREDPDWQSRVRRCSYRPLDDRWIYWSEAMIDWPRPGVTCHLEIPGNLALVARRQMPPGEPCHYFWIARGPILDGLIRSDNRGSESFFPLYVDASCEKTAAAGSAVAANFSPEVIQKAADRFGLTWKSHGRGDLRTDFGPEDLLHYIYALFFSETYRTRYAELLRLDFPRIFFPSLRDVAVAMIRLGRHLVRLHTLGPEEDVPNVEPVEERVPCPHRAAGRACEDDSDTEPEKGKIRYVGGRSPRVESGHPQYRDGRVFLNANDFFEGVTPRAWAYRIGAHQPARKWLLDRKGREIDPAGLRHYARLVGVLQLTGRIVARIDGAIHRAGGWAAVFPLSDEPRQG